MTTEEGAIAQRNEEILSTCRDLLELIDSRMKYLTSRGQVAHRQVAAGALMRARNLLEGLLTLAPQRPDLCGLLLRNLVETFIVGVLLLYDAEMTEVLGQDHERHRRLIIERNGLTEIVMPPQEESSKDRRWNFEQAVKRASEILAERGEPSDKGSMALYDMIYRSESTWGGHGLGVASPYVTESEPFALVATPTGTFEFGPPKIGIAAMYVAFLARYVYAEFRVGSGTLEQLLDRLLELVNAADPDVDS